MVVVLGEPGGLFVNDRETGEFLWGDPFPFDSTERFVISDVDVETGTTYINMDLVAREEGDQFIICGHNVKGWWSWSYSPVTGMLYVPIKPLLPEPDDELPHGLGGQPAVHDSRSGHRSGRRPDRGAGARHLDRPRGCGATASGPRTPARRWRRRGNVVFFGDSNRRFRAFDAETGEVLWETILSAARSAAIR